MAGQETRESMAGQETREAMAEQGAWTAMAGQETREAMAEQGAWTAMADQEGQWPWPGHYVRMSDSNQVGKRHYFKTYVKFLLCTSRSSETMLLSSSADSPMVV